MRSIFSIARLTEIVTGFIFHLVCCANGKLYLEETKNKNYRNIVGGYIQSAIVAMEKLPSKQISIKSYKSVVQIAEKVAVFVFDIQFLW